MTQEVLNKAIELREKIEALNELLVNSKASETIRVGKAEIHDGYKEDFPELNAFANETKFRLTTEIELLIEDLNQQLEDL